MEKIDQLAINALRMLSMDQINRANSGHPGLPLGAAPMAYALWTQVMNHNPKDSTWPNRDRFVLSAGHGSALLYSLLHLSGYDVSMEDLKNFRQLGSRTPGHPEYRHTDGIEATTGPLGQGIANAVGMAMAEAHLAALYNKEDYPIVDHYTYCLCGDGDLMEGVSAEAASLAGNLKLGRLIVLYDSNDISLDGPTSLSFTENVGLRFKSYNWQVLSVPDGNDTDAIVSALEHAKSTKDQPTLIIVSTTIGYGSPNAGTNKVHGAPLKEEEMEALRENLDWHEKPFTVPSEVYGRFSDTIAMPNAAREEAWKAIFAGYAKQYPELAAQFENALAGKLPEDWSGALPVYSPESPSLASRKSSEAAIQALASRIPTLWGGSADLASSNNTAIKGEPIFRIESDAGRNIYYGVREFAMAAINNGILFHGGTKVYGATFFVFSDYLRPAVRVAALSHLPAIYVMTHDSVAVGEDGPTHEPIEQLASWRAMPNLNVIRPADANEVNAAWEAALESNDHPTMLVLSRQNLKNLRTTEALASEGVRRGGYVISPAEGKAQGILIATGSEVALCIAAQQELAKEGIGVSVVSMPSFSAFDAQDPEYQESVLPAHIRNRMSVEAGSTFGWQKYTGLAGINLGIDEFGASGKGELVLEKYGFSAESIVARYKAAFVK